MSKHNYELEALLYAEEMLLFQKNLDNWEEYDTFVAKTLQSYEEEQSIIEDINKEDACTNQGNTGESETSSDRERTSEHRGPSDWYSSYLRSIKDPEEGEGGY